MSLASNIFWIFFMFSSLHAADILTSIQLESLVPPNELRDFTTDGCSWSPDGSFTSRGKSWVHCCINHDIAYWAGGTKVEKEKADEELKQCIGDLDYSKTARVFRWFVDKFGGPNSESDFRWAYGWKYYRQPDGFSALREVEVEQVLSHLNRLDIGSLDINESIDYSLEPIPSKSGDYCLDQALLLSSLDSLETSEFKGAKYLRKRAQEVYLILNFEAKNSQVEKKFKLLKLEKSCKNPRKKLVPLVERFHQ